MLANENIIPASPKELISFGDQHIDSINTINICSLAAQKISSIISKEFVSYEDTLTFLLAQEGWRGILSVGTWWSTIVCLIVISAIAGFVNFHGLPDNQSESLSFYVPLTYSVGLSMLMSAPINGLLSHNLSADIFNKNYSSIANAVSTALAIILIFSFGSSFFIHYILSSRSIATGLVFSVVTSSMSALWVCNNVMTLIQKEKEVVAIFFAGLLIPVIGTWAAKKMGRHVGSEAVLIMLAFGFIVTAFWQYGYIVKLYQQSNMNFDFSFLHLNKESMIVVLFLVFFNLGMWIDKIIYWYSDSFGKKLGDQEMLFRYSDYDYPFFLVFTLFSFSQFLILRKLKEFLKEPQQLFSKGLFLNLPFSHLDENKRKLIVGYRNIMNSLLFIYGTIVIVSLLLVYMKIISVPWKNPFIFTILLISTLVLGVFFLNLIILQYTNQYKLVAFLSCFFFFSNCFATYFTVAFFQHQYFYQGVGFLVASLATAALSFNFVEKTLGRWEYVVIKNIANNF